MTSNLTTSLLVEGDPENIYLIGEALKKSNLNSQLAIVQNAEEMLDYLYHSGIYA